MSRLQRQLTFRADVNKAALPSARRDAQEYKQVLKYEAEEAQRKAQRRAKAAERAKGKKK